MTNAGTELQLNFFKHSHKSWDGAGIETVIPCVKPVLRSLCGLLHLRIH